MPNNISLPQSPEEIAAEFERLQMEAAALRASAAERADNSLVGQIEELKANQLDIKAMLLAILVQR